jgi:hypothetical protein
MRFLVLFVGAATALRTAPARAPSCTTAAGCSSPSRRMLLPAALAAALLPREAANAAPAEAGDCTSPPLAWNRPPLAAVIFVLCAMRRYGRLRA